LEWRVHARKDRPTEGTSSSRLREVKEFSNLEQEKSVRDLMVPLDEYARVPESATLLQAILALREAQQNQPEGRDPFKAILVVDEHGTVRGKVGQFGLVHALGSAYSGWVDVDELERMGISAETISSIRRHHEYFQEGLSKLCRRVRSVMVKEIMQPAAESIDVNASLHEAIEKISRWQTLALLVTSEAKVVGVLRLADLYQQICEEMISAQEEPSEN
jgi:CBS-domain-containing membrane protein